MHHCYCLLCVTGNMSTKIKETPEQKVIRTNKEAGEVLRKKQTGNQSSPIGIAIKKAIKNNAINIFVFALIIYSFFESATAGVTEAIMYQFAFNGKVSGRMDGNVLNKNGTGRKMTVPALVRNVYTALSRSILSTYSSLWGGLTDANRATWLSFTTNKTNRFGTATVVKGKQAYTEINTNLTNISAGSVTDAPIPKVPAPSLLLVALTADASSGTVSLAFIPDMTTNVCLVYATSPQSPGTSRPGQSKFKLIGTFDATGVSPVALGADYVSRFGVITGVAGSKIFVQVKNIATTGNASAITAMSTIVVA